MIITTRLTKVLNLHILSPSQTGFWKGMGPMTALCAMVDMIEDAKYTNNELHLAYVDCKKAFDSEHHQAILDTLEVYGTGQKFTNIIKAIYTNCPTNFVINGDKSQDFYIEQGVQQGDTLSPLLFITTINPLLEWINQDQNGYTYAQGLVISIITYCDDLVLVSSNHEGLSNSFNKLIEFG